MDQTESVPDFVECFLQKAIELECRIRGEAVGRILEPMI